MSMATKGAKYNKSGSEPIITTYNHVRYDGKEPNNRIKTTKLYVYIGV